MENEEKDEVGGEHSAEYKAEFDKLAAGEAPSETPLDDKPKAPEEEVKEPEVKEEEPLADDKPAKKDDGKPEGGDAPAAEDPPKEDPAKLAKALKDTKSWGTKLAMEKAALEKEVAELKAGGSSKEKIDAAKASIGETRKILDEKIKKASEDYPELKEVLDLLATTSYEGLSKAKDFEKNSKEETERLEARQHFEAEVEPTIVAAHPDFRKVAFSKEYMAWVETQSPATQYAAMNSLDPEDIIGTITKFKKANAGGEVEKQRLAEEKRQKGIKENLSTVRGGGSVSKTAGKPTKLEDLDPNDREGAFKFLADQEAKASK
ncbi:MAG: hypothetical protein WC713_04150 [Candidatus Methylomirabilota bacterium]|jgi:hypothetical protein